MASRSNGNTVLACRELAKAQAVPEGLVLVPKEPTSEMLYHGYAAPDNLAAKYKAMIEAQEPAND